MKIALLRWKGAQRYLLLDRGKDTVRVLCDKNKLQGFKAFRDYIRRFCLLMEEICEVQLKLPCYNQGKL